MPDNEPYDYSWFRSGGPRNDDAPSPAVPSPAAPYNPQVDTQAAAAPVAVVTHPQTLLWAAVAIAVAALLLAPLASGRPAVAVVGWLLGGFVAVGLVSLWSYQDARARTSLWYLGVRQTLPLRPVVLVLCVAAVVVHAYAFADWAARR